MKALLRIQHGHYTMRLVGPSHPNDKFILGISDGVNETFMALDCTDMIMLQDAAIKGVSMTRDEGDYK